MKKPLIGITLDSEESGDYSRFPWYAIRQNYLDTISEFGGIPFPLFHNIQSISELGGKLDGLIITGGSFDINPELYGKNILGSRVIKNKRTEYFKSECDRIIQSRYETESEKLKLFSSRFEQVEKKFNVTKVFASNI